MKRNFLTYLLFGDLLFASEGFRFDRRTSLEILEIGTRGTFTGSNLAELHRTCEECYELFKEPDIQVSCKSNCFKNDFFNLCTSSLMLHDQEEALQLMIDEMQGVSE